MWYIMYIPGHFKEERVESQKCREVISCILCTQWRHVFVVHNMRLEYEDLEVIVLACVIQSMFSKSWFLFLPKDPYLISVMAWFIMSYLGVLWIGGHGRSFLQKQWMNMINVHGWNEHRYIFFREHYFEDGVFFERIVVCEVREAENMLDVSEIGKASQGHCHNFPKTTIRFQGLFYI